MGLPELRRLCIRRQLSVSFLLPSGVEVCINQHGATVVDGQAGAIAPEEEFPQATRFRMLTKASERWRPVSRNALERLAMELTGSARPRLSQREI